MQSALSQDEQEAIKNFLLQARQFCDFLDACVNLDQSKLVHNLSVRLARICEAGARLPSVKPLAESGNDFTEESVEADSSRCVDLALRLRKQLGSLDEYWDVFDPTQREEPIRCSISMDLADIHRDLRDALRIHESAAEADDVYWQWRFDFQSHWSRHAANALKVVLILSGRV